MICDHTALVKELVQHMLPEQILKGIVMKLL